VKPEVEEAVEEIRQSGVGAHTGFTPDADGGAFVLVDGVEIGEAFSPSVTSITFQIVWTYPDSDCYPHFIDAGITYIGTGPTPNQHVDGNLPTSMTRGATAPGFGQAAIQVSRRSNRRNAENDSALQKLLRVIEFLRSR
jgi:hypothetical protein